MKINLSGYQFKLFLTVALSFFIGAYHIRNGIIRADKETIIIGLIPLAFGFFVLIYDIRREWKYIFRTR